MTSPHDEPSLLPVEEQSVLEDVSAFPRAFEENLNRELLIASLDDGPPPLGSGSSEEGSFSTKEPSALLRGLQVPSRAKSPASGFEYPPILEKMGISKEDWEKFSDEIRSHARMNQKQWRDTVGAAVGTIFVGGFMVGFLSAIPGVIIGKKTRNKKEKENFKAADRSGALVKCIGRWNRDFFFQRGLAVRVDVPGSAADMARMDVSTSKHYKEGSETGSISTQSSHTKSGYSDSIIEEGRVRRKAAGRGRIVLMPLDESASVATDPEQLMLLPETHEGQSAE